MKERKGIVLAGGSGTRLHPVTQVISKQLLPVYDKPMIYYPIATLMLAGIKDILLISTPRDLPSFKKLLGDGGKWGVNIEYAEQPKPEGLAQALIIGDDFLDGNPSALILGDNLFYGAHLSKILHDVSSYKGPNLGADIFIYHVSDPNRYGVAEVSEDGRVFSIEEKPSNPKSPWAITGLYFFDETASALAKTLKPSKRKELEIVDLLKLYLNQNELRAIKLGRGYSWLDTGTHQSLIDASLFVSTVQRRQNIQVCCLEEIAYNNGWIDEQQVLQIATSLKDNALNAYLNDLVREV